MRKHGARARRRQHAAHIAAEKAVVLSVFEARCKRRAGGAPVMTDAEARDMARSVIAAKAGAKAICTEHGIFIIE